MIEFIFILLTFQQNSDPQTKPETVEYKSVRSTTEKMVADHEEHKLEGDLTEKIARDSAFLANVKRAIIRLTYVDECVKTYHQTIDKKTVDLTVRESTSVKLCQTIDMYPYQMPESAQKRP
jgi:hypothetical protein